MKTLLKPSMLLNTLSLDIIKIYYLKNSSLLNNDGYYLIDIDGSDGSENPLNYQEFGITNTTNPDSFFNGSLINRQSGCTDPDIYMRINSDVLNKLNAKKLNLYLEIMQVVECLVEGSWKMLTENPLQSIYIGLMN